jgi:hypothetical protein
MTKKNNTDALKSHSGFKNLILLALHIGVLAISIWIHPVSFTSADRALPYAVS